MLADQGHHAEAVRELMGQVEGLVSIPRRALEPPPAESSGVAEFLSAIGRDKVGPVAILDLPRLVETARARAVPAGSSGA